MQSALRATHVVLSLRYCTCFEHSSLVVICLSPLGPSLYCVLVLGLGWPVASPGRFGCVMSLVSFSGFQGFVRPPPHRRRFCWSAFRGVRFLLFPSLSGLALVVARVGGVFVSFSSLLRPPPSPVFVCGVLLFIKRQTHSKPCPH